VSGLREKQPCPKRFVTLQCEPGAVNSPGAGGSLMCCRSLTAWPQRGEMVAEERKLNTYLKWARLR
jgi:hypothetical protein